MTGRTPVLVPWRAGACALRLDPGHEPSVLEFSAIGCFSNIWQHCTGNTVNQEVKEIMQNVTSVTFIIVT